jgi:hypothetical protein
VRWQPAEVDVYEPLLLEHLAGYSVVRWTFVTASMTVRLRLR